MYKCGYCEHRFSSPEQRCPLCGGENLSERQFGGENEGYRQCGTFCNDCGSYVTPINCCPYCGNVEIVKTAF